jgi:hypothetical protein
MGITLVWEAAKLFMTLSAGLYAVLALIFLIYLPFCIAECLRQRRAQAQSSAALGRTPAVETASSLQPIV